MLREANGEAAADGFGILEDGFNRRGQRRQGRRVRMQEQENVARCAPSPGI